MKNIVKTFMWGFIFLLATQHIAARTLTVYNLNGWGDQGAVEITQKSAQITTHVGRVAGAPLYDDPKIEQGSWFVPSEAFTLQFKFTKPRASLNMTVEKGDQDIAVEVGPRGFKRV